MKSWPSLLAVLLGSTLIVTGILLRPTCPDFCPTVERECGCSAEECQAEADADCEKHVGFGFVALSYCSKGEP